MGFNNNIAGRVAETNERERELEKRISTLERRIARLEDKVANVPPTFMRPCPNEKLT